MDADCVVRRMTLSRTAKSCGSGAPTLALSWRKRSADDGGKKARSPGRSRISRKTIAQGMPVAAGEPVVANACAFRCTRGRGCIGHSAFPAPSPASRVVRFDSSDISCREKAKLRPILTVMPRESGASSTRRRFGSITALSGILDRPVEPVEPYDDDSKTPTQPGCPACRRSRPRVSRTPPTTAKRRCRTWRPSAWPASGS